MKLASLIIVVMCVGCAGADLAVSMVGGMTGQLIADKIEAVYPDQFIKKVNTNMGKLMTIKESYEYLGISRVTFIKIRNSSNPPPARYIDVGGATHARYTKDDLDKWSESLPTTHPDTNDNSWLEDNQMDDGVEIFDPEKE